MKTQFFRFRFIRDDKMRDQALNPKRLMLLFVTVLLTYGVESISYGEVCEAGDILAPGESCTYPGTDAEFSVLNNGSGQFLFFSSGNSITLRNTTINGVSYTLVANKLASGSWEIEEIAGSTAPSTTNTAPTFTEGVSTTRTIAENTAANTNIGTPIAATDADNDTLTYTLSGTDAASFGISSSTGQLQTKSALDYETKTTYTVTVTVSDGTLTDTIAVTINVTDVNETPAATGVCQVGDVLAPGQSCTYPGTNTEFSVLNNGSGKFGFFTSSSALNIKNTTINGVVYTLVAKKLASGSWKIEEIADSAAPKTTNTAPTFTDGVSTTRSVAENTAAGVHIGTPVAATDADNDTLTYTLVGTDAASFGIDATTGQLKTKATLDYETKRSYTVTVTASDGSLTDTITVTINVTDVAETPVVPTLNLLSDRTPEVRDAIVAAVPGVNSANNVTAAHLAAITNLHLNDKSITSLKTNDFSGLSSLTSLNLNDNQLTTLPKGVFSGLSLLTTLNLNDNRLTTLPGGVFGRLSSLATIGLNSNQLTTLPQGLFSGLSSLQVIVLNGNQLITLPDGIFEGLSGLQLLHLHENTVDPLPLTISYSKVGEGQFKAVAPIGTPFAIVLPVTVTNGSINGGTTTITIPAGSVESNALTVTRTPGTTAAVTVDIGTLPGLPANHQGYQLTKSTNLPLEIISVVNRAPVFTNGASTARTVAENTVAGIHIGSAVIATDADNDTLTYTLSGTDAASFGINSSTGQLQTKSALDYETKRSYTVTITVFDGSLTDTITVTINITNVADTPGVSGFTPVCDRTPQVRDGIVAAVPGVSDCNDVTAVHLAAITALNLNSTNIAALKSGDFDGLSSLYELRLERNQLRTLPSDIFSGLSSLWALFLGNNQLTHLPADVFSGLSALQHIYLNQNQLGSLPADVFSGLTSLVQINLHTNQLTNLPTDVFSGLPSLIQIYLRNNRLTNLSPALFSGLSSLQSLYLDKNRLTTLPAGVFSGLSSLKQLLLNDNQMSTLSREMFRGLTASTWLWLQGNTVDPLPLTVSLEKVGTNQFKATVPAGAPFTIVLPLRVVNGTISGGVNTVTIPQGSVESGRLTVTRTSGTTAAVTVDIGVLPGLPANHQGYQLAKPISPPLEIISGPGNSAPVFTEGTSTSRSVAENTAPGKHIGTAVTATDADNDTPTYTLGGTDAADFIIDATTGQLKTSAPLDYETKRTYTVTVSVSDGNGGSDTINVTINVTDIDESLTDTGVCKVGDILAPGESCTYPGTDATFSVLNNGHARWNIPNLPSWLAWANQASIGGSLSFTATINSVYYHFVAEEVPNDSWEIKEIGGDRPQQPETPEQPEQPGDTGTTPTLTASTTSPLTEATLNESIVTLTLSGGTYESSNSRIRNDVTVSTSISGVTVRSFDIDRESDTEITVELTFDGTDFDTNSTITFTVGSGAIVDYDGAALTEQVSVTASTESVITSTTAPLTEATLDESVVTLTLSGRNFERFNSRIRGAVSVSGISGVTVRSFDIDRVSDTQVTVELTFSGNISTDSTLTFTVGPGAIADYNGAALTAQVSVSASTEVPADTGIQDPEEEDTPAAQDYIQGPWLWMIASGADIDTDYLAVESGGTVTEAQVAQNGMNEGDYLGELQWTRGQIYPSTHLSFWGIRYSNNVNHVVNAIGLTTDHNLNHYSAYALINIISTHDQNDIQMGVGSDDAVKVWLNGTVVHRNDVNRRTSGIQDRFRVNLKAGNNLLLVKVSDDWDNWGMFFKIYLDEADFTTAIPKAKTDNQFPDTPQPPVTTNTAPIFTNGASTTRTIAENTAAGIHIGRPVVATDADNDTLTYTLGGTNAAAFNIDATTGQLKTRAALDYETKRSYTVTVTVSDGSLTDTITITITITDVAETPIPQQPEQPQQPQQPGGGGGTPTLRASTTSPLTEATLNESIVTLTLSGGTYVDSRFNVALAIKVSGINGVTFNTWDVDDISDTEIEVELTFDGDFDTNATLTFTVGAEAIAGYDGAALTAQVSVTANMESVAATTTSPLTEATLDESVVTLTLSGRNFERFNSRIRGAVSVSGISGVTVRSFDINRVSDTQVTVELTFSGNISTDNTLTFTVGPGAIEDYNGAALTAQVSVTATQGVLRALSGISFIHVPLRVTAVDGVAQTIESVGDLYDALGGPATVNLLITHDPKTQEWHSYLEESSRGTSADTVLTDNQGIIADMKVPVSIRLEGDALGNNGNSSITLHPGPNLVGIPLRDSRITHVSDLLALEGIGGNVSAITVLNNGTLQTVEQTGEVGDISITGGQSFILNARETTTVAISGQGWDNVSGAAAAAPGALTGIEVGDATPVLALTGSILSSVGGRGRLPHLRSGSGFRVIVKSLSTGSAVATMIGDKGERYQLTVVDTEAGRAAQIGDILEISVRSPDPRIGVQPLRHTVTAEDVKRSRVELGNLIVYEIPTETALLPNYPNPFNPETWIPYRLAEDAFVTLTIYDGNGQVVRSIDVGYKSAAVYKSKAKAIHWNGRNEFGEQVASGVYFYHLSAGGYSATRKMLILK